MPTETERAYLAGLIDGEGHIGITLARQHPTTGNWITHSVILTVANNHIETLSWAQSLWPRGSLVMKRATAISRTATGALRWSSGTAVAVLRDVAPYLRVKRAQALLAIQFGDEVAAREHRNRFITPAEWERREELRIAVRQLNRPDPTLAPVPYPIERHEKVCAQCGTPFTDEQRTNRKHCSAKCRNAAAWQRFKAKHAQPIDAH